MFARCSFGGLLSTCSVTCFHGLVLRRVRKKDEPSVPQLPPPGGVADKPVMAQPASDEPASPEGGADDGAFCVGSGLSESRQIYPRDRSSTHDLPACAHHSPPLCMRDTRPQCTTRCALLVSLGGVGVACVLTAGALLLAACWCARRRDAASRFASCAEPAAAAQCVASVLPHGSATWRPLLGASAACLPRQPHRLHTCAHVSSHTFPTTTGELNAVPAAEGPTCQTQRQSRRRRICRRCHPTNPRLRLRLRVAALAPRCGGGVRGGGGGRGGGGSAVGRRGRRAAARVRVLG